MCPYIIYKEILKFYNYYGWSNYLITVSGLINTTNTP